MTFKVDDMVRIVAPPVHLTVEPYQLIGSVGTITGPAGWAHRSGGTCWDIKLPNGEIVWACEACMRLIPGDTEGRKVVDWNWRDLASKRPVVA